MENSKTCSNCGTVTENPDDKWCPKCHFHFDSRPESEEDKGLQSNLSPLEWYKLVLYKYAVIEGRAHRTEFWIFILLSYLIYFGLAIIGTVIESAGFGLIIASIYWIFTISPTFCVGIRRLHDTNHSGWWSLIAFIPGLGLLVLLIFALMDSDQGENDFGPSPKYPDSRPKSESAQTIRERIFYFLRILIIVVGVVLFVIYLPNPYSPVAPSTQQTSDSPVLPDPNISDARSFTFEKIKLSMDVSSLTYQGKSDLGYYQFIAIGYQKNTTIEMKSIIVVSKGIGSWEVIQVQ